MAAAATYEQQLDLAFPTGASGGGSEDESESEGATE